MSIRISVCVFVVLWLCIQAWRGKWFWSACGAVIMMAFLERKDMPRAVLGIPGLNLWNFLMINTTCAWLALRDREGLIWDFPQDLKKWFLMFLAVIVWSFSRFFIDPTEYWQDTRFIIFIGYLINPLKFLLPGFIIFDGCRDRRQMTLALGAILLTYFILACFTIKYMGLSDFSGKELSKRAARVIQRDVGYHRVDMSMMLAGASWGILAFSLLIRQFWLRVAFWGASGLVLVGQALTGGRAGYVTWGIIGLTLCVMRWRKVLPLIPLAVLLVFAFAPGVRERLLEGVGSQKGGVVTVSDTTEVTAGRSTAWPLVMEKIKESPIIGYGRNAMARTGLTYRLRSEFNDEFGHPHNAYFEMLLDNGVVGFVLAMPVFFILMRRSLILFRDPHDILWQAAGGVGLALVMALMIASFSAQTFYPREGVVGMWAAVGLMLRAWQERENQAMIEQVTEAEFEWIHAGDDGWSTAPPFPAGHQNHWKIIRDEG